MILFFKFRSCYSSNIHLRKKVISRQTIHLKNIKNIFSTFYLRLFMRPSVVGSFSKRLLSNLSVTSFCNFQIGFGKYFNRLPLMSNSLSF